MSPAELRAEAKALRKRARELDKEAESLEFAEEHRRKVSASREALEARAAAYSPRLARGEGTRRRPVGHRRCPGRTVPRRAPTCARCVSPVSQHVRYRVSDGYLADWYAIHEDRRRLGQLDAKPTLEAWRTWCAERKAREMPQDRE